MKHGSRWWKMVENLQNIFLETLHDLSLSIAYLGNSCLLLYEIKILADKCKISESEVFKTLETAKKEKWILKK
jgi:60S ribosomal protein L35